MQRFVRWCDARWPGRLADVLLMVVGTLMLIGLAAALFNKPAGAQSYYTPDYIDIERHKNWRALQAERRDRCLWWGENCHWRHVYRYPRATPPDPAVKWAQQKLQALGYELDDDGRFGSETRDVVRRFQMDSRRLEVTGRLDDDTYEALQNGHRRNGEDGGDSLSEKLWAIRPKLCREPDGRECTCDPIIVFSGEHVGKDARTEVVKRWRGHVRAMLGELFIDWNKAAPPKSDHCWFTGTGERTSDRLGQVRCVAQGRACFGPPPPGEDDDPPPVPPVSKRRGVD